MNFWGEVAEGRQSLLKSFKNIYGILWESLGTFVQSLGKVWDILSECLWNPEGISMNLWGEAAEGRPSLLKSFQNIYGILRESLGTFVQSLGKVWEILSECLWNPEGISGKHTIVQQQITHGTP